MYEILEFNHAQDFIKIVNIQTQKILQVSNEVIDYLRKSNKLS